MECYTFLRFNMAGLNFKMFSYAAGGRAPVKEFHFTAPPLAITPFLVAAQPFYLFKYLRPALQFSSIGTYMICPDLLCKKWRDVCFTVYIFCP